MIVRPDAAGPQTLETAFAFELVLAMQPAIVLALRFFVAAAAVRSIVEIVLVASKPACAANRSTYIVSH